MQDIEKTIEKLTKLHAKYEAEVAALTGKRDALSARLVEVSKLAAQTFEALAILKGEPTFMKALQAALDTPKSPLNGIGVELAQRVAETDKQFIQNFSDGSASGLPPAEPGMQWAKNEVGEDVLVPVVIPAPLSVPGVTQSEFYLPAVDDDAKFGDTPESFLT